MFRYKKSVKFLKNQLCPKIFALSDTPSQQFDTQIHTTKLRRNPCENRHITVRNIGIFFCLCKLEFSISS